ncbi:MAG: SDR family oxidoreductase [Gemmatimonadales bacterium]
MAGKVCLITGANRGIGRAVTTALAGQGATVLMACRNRETGETARAQIAAATGNPDVRLFVADLAVQDQVRRLAEEVRASQQRLDVFISNAAAYYSHRTLTPDGIEATFAVNHLAGFILAEELGGLLAASAPSRVVIVSSDAHYRVSNPEDWTSSKGYSGRNAYSRSKLANVIFGYDLAHRLERSGITVNSCHPGIVDTRILHDLYDRWWLRWMWPIARRVAISPEEGARTIVQLATSPEVEGVTGKYFRNGRPASSALISHDPVIGARLWNVSLRLTGKLPPSTVTGEIIAATNG